MTLATRMRSSSLRRAIAFCTMSTLHVMPFDDRISGTSGGGKEGLEELVLLDCVDLESSATETVA